MTSDLFTNSLIIVDNDTSPGKLISENLPIASYTASNSWTSEGQLPDMAFDGSASTSWNAGNYASQWIEVDLGQEYYLYSIQLLIAQLPGGSTTHEVWVSNQSISNSYNGATLAKTFQGYTDNLQWLESDFSNSTKGRYVQVTTVSSPSWIAWLEIQIYGEPLISPSSILAFDQPTFSVNEDGTTIQQVTVTRTGGSSGSVAATINLTNGTATAVSDYNNTSITVTFADGEITKTVSIPIVNDNLIEGNETVNLTLTNPTNGATIGTQNTATLTIVDNDLPNIGKWTTVTNGEFETGDLNGWSHISTNTSWGNLWTITSDRSISGNFSAKAVTNTGFNGNGYALQRTVTGLIAGEKYVLSGFIYTGELTSGNTYLDLNDIDNDLDIGAGYGIDQWQFVWKEFVAPSNQVTVRLVRDGEEVKAGESAYIDDVAITPISQFIPLISSDAPTLAQAIADQNAKQGNVFNFQIPTNTFTDIDAGDVLTYSATLENGNALPSWLTFNSTTRTFSGTPTNDNVGSLNVKAIATDQTGATVSDIFVITVENVNDAPIVSNLIADQTVKVNSTFTFTLPKNTFSDPDAVNLYKNLVIFGDSLSDTGNAYQASGNTFPPPPNYQGRLSNGLIWVDYLAPDLQFTDQSIENFAFLGANTGVSNTFGQITVPGLLTQIQQFKTLNTATPIGKDGLYVIWAGANDFLNPATDPTQAVTNAVTNISSAIATLAELGAKEIVVGNLTDLGATPFSIANNNVANARLISIGFNAALNQALTNLEPVLNVDLSLVDIFGLSTAFQTNPASYNFTNITQPLITVTNPVNPDQYAFWDDVHPTTKLHQLVTDTFVNTLLNDGVIPDLIKYSATLADGSNLPDWLNFNSTTRTFTGTPKTANIGQLNVKVIATDKAGANVSDIFTFYLENVNNAPTNITINNSTVAENQAIGTVIGNLSTTDPDTANTFTYSLVTGTGATDNSLFTITNNQLKTNSVFDYETKNSYSIRVKTTDQDGLSYEKELTININDLNEITGNTLINNGRNPIVGTAGSDYITGGPGAKTITGGAGSDSFVFTNLRDVGQRITDFTLGEDKIVLSQLFSSISYTGTNPIADQYIQFVAGIGSNANSTFLQIDRDGSLGSAIFKNFLQLDNITTTQLNNINNFVF